MRSTPWMLGCVGIMLLVLGVQEAGAQAATPEGMKVELGPVFESQVGGIALRPPAGSKQIARGAEPDLIVEFVNDEKRWSLKVHRATFSRPMALSKPDAPLDERGILELTAAAFASSHQGVQILRQDVVNQGAFDLGMLAMRYGPHGQRKLVQQAILSVSNRVFYTLSFTSPTDVPGGTETDADEVDPQERQAVAVFSAILDTVKLLDRRHIKEEQDERLRRTQALMVNFHERKITDIARKEQWLRLLRDGKDIGYLYVVEEPYTYHNKVGTLVLVRSRTVPDEGMRVDGATSMWVSYDRDEEFWVSSAVVDSGKPKKQMISETGTSYKRIANVRVDQPADPRSTRRAPLEMKQVQEHLMTVERTLSGAEGTPLIRELPPYYLPQALGHLLPRLMPLGEPQGYLFVSWVSDRQELMFRYVDVEPAAQVDILGQKVEAVAIQDRLGLQGTPTTHYMSPDGKYLGSKSEAQGDDGRMIASWILPTEASALQAIWKTDAQLTRPDVATPQRKEPKPNGR